MKKGAVKKLKQQSKDQEGFDPEEEELDAMLYEHDMELVLGEDSDSRKRRFLES